MNEQTLQTMAIKKSLELSEQDAQKVAIFIMGMNAGKEIQDTPAMPLQQEPNRAS